MKKNQVFALLLAITILVTISACQPTQTSTDNQQPNVVTGSNEVQNIQVDKTSPQKTIASTEDFPLPNCGGTETLKQTLGTQVSVSKNVQMGTTVSVSGGYEVGVPEVSKATVKAAIEAAYQQEYETANSRLDTIEMGAASKTHVIYTIEWERQEFSSIVTYELNKEIVKTPYTFIMNVPKISGSREEICPTLGLVVPSTAIPTNQSNIDPAISPPVGQDGPFRPHYQVDVGDGVFDKGTFSDGMAEYSQDWLRANGYDNIQRIRQEEFPSGCDVSRHNTNLIWISGTDGMQFAVNDQVVGTYKAVDDSHGYIFEYSVKFGDKLCVVNYKPATGYAILLGPNIYYHYDSYCYRGNCK